MTGVPPETPALRSVRVRVVGAAILLAFAAVLALDAARMLPLQSAWFDVFQRLSPRVADPMPVTIVQIDERSLSALGPWPWPRTLLAQLMHTINAYGPAAIGVDIVMPDPDPFSPERVLAHVDADSALLERLASLPSNDAELASAFHAAPTVVVLADAPGASTVPLRVAPVLVRDASGQPDAAARAISSLAKYPGALSSLATLSDAASGWGLISVDDAHGIIRRVPLVANVNGTLAPAFALEMWRVALHASTVRMATANGAVDGVTVGDRTFATEGDGRVRLYYSHPHADRVVSAVDALSGSAGTDLFHRSFVLIGVTVLALGDQVWTPLGDKPPGVEIHAQLLENMLGNAFLMRPRWAPIAEAAALLLVGALLVWLTPRWPVRYAALAATASGAALLAASYGAFRSNRLLFDAATPTMGLLLFFATLLALTLADATRNRKALQHVVQLQREESARVAGELQAARRIQMETLPRPDCLRDPRVELAASMEPALEVGGDLYDFYPIDTRRLFFMLGDVSGKGLSASIFMAVSKALCKSTMLRSPAADLGALVTAANVEVARDNPGALFVTMFAGVLDLDSGELAYCNAGQESPWVIRRADRSLRRLVAGGGGPPLCAVDDFAYESVCERLQAGDLLCVVSDGVTEAQNPAQDLYGSARVDRLLAAAESAGDAVAALRADVASFAAGAEQSDDMTILALRWRGPSAQLE